MSIAVMTLVRQSTIADATEIAVLEYLADRCDEQGGNCFPGLALIALMVRRSERTVIRTLSALEAAGWLDVVERGGGRKPGGEGVPTAFQINIEQLKRCQDVRLLPRSRRVTLATEKGDMVSKKGDKRDNPPHPLLGRTTKEPSGTTTPQPPQAGELDFGEETSDAGKTEDGAASVARDGVQADAVRLAMVSKSVRAEAGGAGAMRCALEKPTGDLADNAVVCPGDAKSGQEKIGFDAEQLAHLERCANLPKRREWERWYLEQNAARDDAARAELERTAAARAEFPDRQTAIHRVMRKCGFQLGVRRNPLPEVIGQVLAAERDDDKPVWATALRLIAAWEAQRGAPRFTRRYKPLEFFRDGHWREFA